MNNEVFNKCIKVLKTSDTDNELLAALLMVTKVVKADEADISTAKTIFSAVGTRFLRRLLLTGSTTNDCSGLDFKSVGVSVLACLCSVPGFVQDMYKGLADLLPHIARITKLESRPSESKEAWKQLVADCYDCLTCIVSVPSGQQAFIETGCVATACEAIASKCILHERGLQLIVYLCGQCGPPLWLNTPEALLGLIVEITRQLLNQKGTEMFELCSILSTLIMAGDSDQIEEVSKTDVPGKLHKLLFHLLQNKMGQEHRASVLQLCSVMVDKFGVTWVLSQGEFGHKFLLLMVHLACIEIRMNLECEQLAKVTKFGNLLSTCYGLLEHVIEHLTAAPSLQLDDKQVAQLHSAMVGAFNAVIQFLDRAATEADVEMCKSHLRPIIVASVRVLGSWIAEETSALRKEVVALLPFLIEIGRATFLESKNIPDHPNGESAARDGPNSQFMEFAEVIPSDAQSDDEETELHQPDRNMDTASLNKDTASNSNPFANMENSKSDFDSEVIGKSLGEEHARVPSTNHMDSFIGIEVLQFLMPGLCHLSAEDSARVVLMTSDLTQLLCDYLVYQWDRLRSKKRSLGAGKEPVVAMTTTCGVILNIVVLEAHAVEVEPVFGELFCLVACTLEKLDASEDDLMTLRYNLMLLGLMIIRRRLSRKDMPQGTMDDFVRDSIKLLRQVHYLSTVTAKTLCVHPCWQDLSELWNLAIMVLCECLPYLPWLSKTILSCKWLPRICKLLMDVKKETVPEEIIMTYQSLILNMAQASAQATNVLKEAGALQVVRKYRTPLTPNIEAALA